MKERMGIEGRVKKRSKRVKLKEGFVWPQGRWANTTQSDLACFSGRSKPRPRTNPLTAWPAYVTAPLFPDLPAME